MRWARWIALVSLLAVCSRFVVFGGDSGHDRDRGTPIWVFDHGYHAGLILSRTALVEFGGEMSDIWLAHFPAADWFEFGWGDAGFYFEVPTYEDVTFGIGAKALLWPSDSVMHVATGQGSPVALFSQSDGAEIPVTDTAIRQILLFIEAEVAAKKSIGPGLYGVSAFYEARGKYHLFRTCNSWVSQALRAGNIASAPGFGVLSSTLLWDLKRWYH